MDKNLFLVLALIISFSLSSLPVMAQLNPERFNPIASLQPSLNLEVLIFPDGSALLNGDSDIDPNLPVLYSNGIISGLTNELTSKQKGIWTFSLTTKDAFDEVNVEVVLPEGAKLVTGSISSNSFPLIYTRGNFLVVEISDIQKSLELSFDYELPIKNERSNTSLLIYLFAALLTAILFFILHKRKKKPVKIVKKKKTKPKKVLTDLEGFKKKFETVRQTLSDREISIIESLIELEGSAKQNQLQKFTGISKAAFSRHISALEAKGLIEKRSLGRVNRIKLKFD